MKVLVVAYKPMKKNILQPEDEYDLTLLGYLAFFDAPKQSAASAIKKLHDLQINIKVLTGDNSRVAASVCRRLGINTERILTCSELNTLSDTKLLLAIEQYSIFAELAPSQKAYIVETLQDNGHAVGFLGDGMNDFPAVAQADVGISVDTATDAVRDIADVILLKKDLNVLSDGVLEERNAFANMSKYIKITASSNFGNICAIVVASVLLPFFPMTSLQLLLLNLLYDILCLILPWDNVDQEVLEKPLELSGHRLSKFMLVFGPPSSIFDIPTFIFLYFVLCPNLCSGSFHILNSKMQTHFITVFQTGWFLKSM
ncbi:MAG: HAD-IC family P-type ATPase [Phascolarctobacterium sp.]|nr:HAD-IC family P-type ATPase [Phascolarctobacterium sp.]